MARQTDEPLALEEAMSGILALLVVEREERLGQAGANEVPTDLVLADAGLSYTAISRLTRRPYKTVESTIRRARNESQKKDGVHGQRPSDRKRT